MIELKNAYFKFDQFEFEEDPFGAIPYMAQIELMHHHIVFLASLSTLCFGEWGPVLSCISLKGGVGFSGVRQRCAAVVD